MKTLLTLAALAVAMSIPAISFAGENVNTFGVELPAEREATNYELTNKALYINTVEDYNALGVQLPLVERNADTGNTNYKTAESKNTLVIFGVKLPVNAG